MADSDNNFSGNVRRLITSDEEILRAVFNHVGLESMEEARPIYAEARKGNKVAQFIVGIALVKAGREEAAQIWLDSSAAQGFEPAKEHKKAG